jgi:hypothetical protein
MKLEEQPKYEGSVFNSPIEGVTLGCISPEARDLLDTIMEQWEKHYEGIKLNITMATSGEQTEPSIYMFAYWLVRWSGLIQPVSQNEK